MRTASPVINSLHSSAESLSSTEDSLRVESPGSPPFDIWEIINTGHEKPSQPGADLLFARATAEHSFAANVRKLPEDIRMSSGHANQAQVFPVVPACATVPNLGSGSSSKALISEECQRGKGVINCFLQLAVCGDAESSMRD